MYPWRYAVNLVANETERKEVTALVNAGFTGKWMPFTAPERVNEVWAAVVEATEAGRLGWKAKVGLRGGSVRILAVALSVTLVTERAPLRVSN